MTPEQKETIIRLKEKENFAWKAIATAVNLKRETVRKFYQRYRLNRDLPPKIVIRKSMITPRQGILIKKTLHSNPRSSIQTIKNALQDEAGPEAVTPSRETLRRFVISQGFERVTPISKPLLREQNIEKRLLFAEKMRAMPLNYHHRFMWSDETMVRAYPQGKKYQIWLRSDPDFPSEAFTPSVQQGGISVMFWGCFSRYARGPLLELKGKQDSGNYLNLIQNVVENELDNSDVPLIFMQDNCSIHKAKPVMDYFSHKNIELLDWPPQSPDLNPIENVLAIIKQKLWAKNTPPTTRMELIDQVFEIWESLDDKLWERLSDSFPKRIDQVISRKGDWIKK